MTVAASPTRSYAQINKFETTDILVALLLCSLSKSGRLFSPATTTTTATSGTRYPKPAHAWHVAAREPCVLLRCQ